MSGLIVTFYSYKGGAGRTMALANTACLLAAAGHRVLAIDWDLEGPGLHRYLHPFLADPDLSKTNGIIDLVWDYAAAAARQGATDGRELDPLSLADPAHVATPTSFPADTPGASGRLHMVGAGKQNAVYADRVRNFDWATMFSRLEGAAFVRRFGEKCRAEYDFTLIDSRTGIADTAGITTIILPDRVVLCFTPNRQSVLGIRAIGDSIKAVRPPLLLLPVVTRVEKGAEGWRDAQEFYRTQLDHLLPVAAGPAARLEYWGAVEIVHYPNYALGELLTSFCDSPADQNSLLSDMRRLVARIVEREFMSSPESFPAPEISEEVRRHYSRRVQFRDPRLAELQAAVEGDASSGLILLQALTAEAWLETELDQNWLGQLASSLDDLGVRLSSLGRRDEALVASQEAVEIRRRLTPMDPDAYLPELAMSLNNVSINLTNLGRREEALAASEETVDVRRRLAQARPAAFLPDLATSLHNVGRDLSDLGRREEALAALQECAEIYRRLAQTQPEAFLSDLAKCLSNISVILSRLGRREEALAAAQESVDLGRRLAQTRSEAFLPDLAVSLNILGIRLSNLGRHEDALAVSREAVEIRRRLAQTRPETFLLDLATSLNNISVILSNLGRGEEALAASQESVDIKRRLVRTRPEAFLPALATGLNNISEDLSNLGRREEALAASQEAVDIYRRLAQSRPEVFLPKLANSIGMLSDMLAALDRHTEAADTAGEGLTILLPFLERYPETHGSLAHQIRSGFLRYSEAAAQKPNAELLKRIGRVLGENDKLGEVLVS